MAKQGSAHDFWNVQRRPLDVIFRPKSVAVIGATERANSVGRTIVRNLLANVFGGTIYPINPKRHSVLGIKAYHSLSDLPEQAELAIIVVPAPIVPNIVRECVANGVKGAIIISAGFKEIGPEGVALEQEILAEAQKGGMRIIGPNCLGVMSPVTGLNATFARRMAQPGTVGFVSQSGAMLTSILDWAGSENVGFSAFVSIGSMLDVDWGDIITYLGDDPNTKSIVIYMESIGNARSFLSAAREVALTKPIIVIKPGRTEAAAHAAASHTGSLTGSDEVLDAAFKRAGVLRVERISDLFNMAELLGKQPLPKGPNLTIVTNAGGPGVISTDALISSGAALTDLSETTMSALDGMLPPHWSHSNPIDILGDATPETYLESVRIAAEDDNADGLLVVLSPQAMTDPTQTAQDLANAAADPHFMKRKPLIASWMGGDDVLAGQSILNGNDIPTYSYPDTAARMFSYMWQFRKNIRALYETPVPANDEAIDRTLAAEIIDHVRETGRTILTEWESKRLLAAYGIPTVQTVLAEDPDKAVEIADEIGYPVVIKLNSETITHKTDVGGVKLNLKNGDAVRGAFETMQAAVIEKYAAEDFLGVTVQPMLDLSEAYELIIGASPDPQFGPVVLFGTGGTLVEVYKDRALALPPLNSNLARRMMARTKIYEALHGVRGRDPVDLDALDSLMVNFSQLVVEQHWIKEIDINPLLASAEQLIALDGRVILYPPEVTQADLPQTAIRPYPVKYMTEFTSKSGLELTMRPIRPEDEPLIVEFHKKLSAESVYMRFFSALNFDRRVSHERLIKVAHVDYDRDMALVVTKANENPDLPEYDEEIMAAGRLTKAHGENEAEFALLVADEYHGNGLGTKMLSELVRIGRDEKLDRIVAYMLPTNRGMITVSQRLGFAMSSEDDLVKATLELNEA